MNVMDRFDAYRGMRARRMHTNKLAVMGHENDRLRIEVESLKDQLRQERNELSRLLDVVESGMGARLPRKHQLRRLAILVAAAAGAFVAISSRGNERLEKITARWSFMPNIGRTDGTLPTRTAKA
jgi:erythromycin esterase-like protein